LHFLNQFRLWGSALNLGELEVGGSLVALGSIATHYPKMVYRACGRGGSPDKTNKHEPTKINI
jgi:hypothetical protein